jgi:hypothetical protein
VPVEEGILTATCPYCWRLVPVPKEQGHDRGRLGKLLKWGSGAATRALGLVPVEGGGKRHVVVARLFRDEGKPRGRSLLADPGGWTQ